MFGLKTSIPTINVNDFKKVMDEKNDYVIIDVRTPGEYSKGKVKSSINIPLDELERTVEKTIPDKNQTVYIYCLSGSRSRIAVACLIQLGFRNVFDVKNGLLAWRAMQYPVE